MAAAAAAVVVVAAAAIFDVGVDVIVLNLQPSTRGKESDQGLRIVRVY